MLKTLLAIALAVALGPLAAQAADHPDLFALTSPDFTDNGFLSAPNAGTGTSTRGPWACGGQNVSPALAWTHAPAGTQSFAVIMDDPDAASGRGGNHWVAYGIPASATSVPRDAGKTSGYHGPCAEPDAKTHHFLWMVFALDLPPAAFAPGLTREQFMQQITGHSLAEASLVSRYQPRSK
jgi:hypothetical protein